MSTKLYTLKLTVTWSMLPYCLHNHDNDLARTLSKGRFYLQKKYSQNIIDKVSVYTYYMQVCDYQLVLDRKLFQETFKRHKSYPK